MAGGFAVPVPGSPLRLRVDFTPGNYRHSYDCLSLKLLHAKQRPIEPERARLGRSLASSRCWCRDDKPFNVSYVLSRLALHHRTIHEIEPPAQLDQVVHDRDGPGARARELQAADRTGAGDDGVANGLAQ